MDVGRLEAVVKLRRQLGLLPVQVLEVEVEGPFLISAEDQTPAVGHPVRVEDRPRVVGQTAAATLRVHQKQFEDARSVRGENDPVTVG